MSKPTIRKALQNVVTALGGNINKQTNAELIDEIADHASGGGGGGGVEDFNITSTWDEDSEAYILNKTWKEIKDAFVAKKRCLVTLTDVREESGTTTTSITVGAVTGYGSMVSVGDYPSASYFIFIAEYNLTQAQTTDENDYPRY